MASWAHITTTNWSYCLSIIAAISKTQLCLTVETSVLANIDLRRHINWILPSHVLLSDLINWLVCVLNNPYMSFFIHEWLSSLKSLFEIRIERLFSNNIRNPIELLVLSLLILRWQLVAIISVEWPLCVIFRELIHLMRSHQFRWWLLALIVFFTEVYPLNLFDCLLFFWIQFSSFIFDRR